MSLEVDTPTPPPALLHRYKNKGLAIWAVRKCMKTKEGAEGCQEELLDTLILEVGR